jgi:hypothetical protein
VLNSYGYARDNPITRKDTNGKQAVQFAGAVIGDFIGVASQLYSDISSGQTSGVSTYVAAGLGGATAGAVIASGGYWYGPFGGLAGGAVQSSVSQGAGLLNGSGSTFSLSDVGSNALSQSFYGFIPGLKIKGVTVGRNSFDAIGKSGLRTTTADTLAAYMQTAKVLTGNVVGNVRQLSLNHIFRR